MTTSVDLDGCASEPIRIPGGIQPHGALLVLDPVTLTLLQRSANAEALLGLSTDSLQQINQVAAFKPLVAKLKTWLDRQEREFLHAVELDGACFQVSAHRTEQGLLLELESTDEDDGADSIDAYYPVLRRLFDRIETSDSVPAIAAAAAEVMRTITRFNRVLVYQFDSQWNGAVIAEDGDGTLPSYLDLRFPASDIPAQARALYAVNRLRIIPDANYTPAPLTPALSPIDGAPLDLSSAALRSVSPVHLQYMRNMGTLASMSVSILVDGKLWGLVSCHNAEPKRVTPRARTACDFVGQVLSLQIGSRERQVFAADRLAQKRIEAQLLTRISAAPDIGSGLRLAPEAWCGLLNADGAAIIAQESIRTTGDTPPPEQIRAIAAAIEAAQVGPVFVTDSLARKWPEFEPIADIASGVVALSISKLHPSYLMWFRREIVRTVTWGGDPRDGKRPGTFGLEPRASFAAWKEQVRMESRAWSASEIETAEDFRNAILNLVLRRAEELAAITEQLTRTNAELEAFSYSVSHDLRAPFRHIAGYAELLRTNAKALDDKSTHYLQSITEATLSAGRLVDDLLAFSNVGRASLSFSGVDTAKLVREVRQALSPDLEGRDIEWRVGTLPPAWGDASLLRQVWMNLLDNAIKYTRKQACAVITISGEVKDGETRFTVSDNGVGFDTTYLNKLFGVFQRLHRVEEFEGTGIGLALCKRIIERHDGWIAADSTLGEGATFSFGLPQYTETKLG